MAVDQHEVEKAILAALQADTTVKGLIGNPVRVRQRVDRDIDFPWVRVDSLAVPPFLRVMGSPPVSVHYYGWQFTAFQNVNTLDTVCDIKKACIEVMNDRSKFSISGHTLLGTEPGNEAADFDESGTAYAMWEYFFVVQ